MSKRLSIAVCFVTVMFGWTLQADAATRTACATGCEFSDLQAAIDAAVFGDTILLRAGCMPARMKRPDSQPPPTLPISAAR